jgi:ABC-type nitrate/sulfonate/bicarbonate transport system permease component
MCKRWKMAYKYTLTILPLFGLWEALVRILDVPEYRVPGPLTIITRLCQDADLLLLHAKVLLLEVGLKLSTEAVDST